MRAFFVRYNHACMHNPNAFFFREPWRTPVLIFVLCLGLFSAFPMTLAGDMEPAILLPISILTEGNVTFDEFVQPEDTEPPFWFRRVKGHIVSAYPLIPGLMNLPAFILADVHFLPRDIVKDRHALTMITTVFIAAGAIVLFFFCLLEILKRRESALFFTFVYAFGTSVWSTVARGLWQHGPSLLFLNAIILILLKKKERLFPLAGLLTGLLVWNRPTNIVFAVAISIFVLWKHRRAALPFLFPSGIVALLFAWYSFSFYGSFLALGQGQPFAWFSGSILINMLAVLISPSRGLFVYTPFFLLVFPALWVLIRKRNHSDSELLLLFLAAALIPFLLIFGKWGMWWGGNVYGYRIITEIVTPLTLVIALWWSSLKKMSPFWNAILIVTLTWSFVVQYIGVVRYPFCETGAEKHAMYQEPSRYWNMHEAQLVRCIERFYTPIKPYLNANLATLSIKEEMDRMRLAPY